jgi:hypothetical protein
MSKVVINTCFGGYGLSKAALDRYLELKGLVYTKKRDHYGYVSRTTDNGDEVSGYTISRDDPFLVQVVEELGDEAFGNFSELEVVEIPEGVLYRIDEYDGMESIEYRDDINWKVG